MQLKTLLKVVVVVTLSLLAASGVELTVNELSAESDSPEHKLEFQGRQAYRQKRFPEAVRHFKDALELQKNDPVAGGNWTNHPVVTHLLGALRAKAKADRTERKAADSLATFLEAVELATETYGADSPRTAIIETEIASLHTAMGQADAALQLYAKALLAFSAMPAEERVNIAEVLVNMVRPQTFARQSTHSDLCSGQHS